MPSRNQIVSIHPWFKIHAGKLEAAKALLPRFIEKTSAEPGCLYYDFTFNGDLLHCREAYVGAEAALAHVQSVGALIGELLQVADLHRIEIHGGASELEKMKAPLKDLPVEWFTFAVGVEK